MRTAEESIACILQSNFDADSKACLLTLMKMVDNLLTKPGDEKVRSVNLENRRFQEKVGCRKGGVDFLLSCGFTPIQTPPPLLSTTSSTTTTKTIQLQPQNESQSKLLSARKLLVTYLTTSLQMDPSDLPPLRIPPPLVTTTTNATTSSSSSQPGRFNPYKSHNYNTQAAAVGAPNPNGIVPTMEEGEYVSNTERQLKSLEEKQKRLEKEQQRNVMEDRGLVALRPGEFVVAGGGGGGRGGGGGDGSLLAGRMKRMEDERKKREEGGFTTKAMRDLEQKKKTKIYSHTQLRISFPDGTSLSASFLPTETIETVKTVISSSFLPHYCNTLQFDLYVAPPRRQLQVTKSLEEEGLVPTAKMFVSWKMGSSEVGSGGGFLREELFRSGGGGGGGGNVLYPEGKSLVEDPKKKNGKKRNKVDNGKEGSGGSSKEDDLMRRMLGQKPGFLGGNKNGGGSGGSGTSGGGKGGGKPKWFKN